MVRAERECPYLGVAEIWGTRRPGTLEEHLNTATGGRKNYSEVVTNPDYEPSFTFILRAVSRRISISLSR